MTTAEMVRGPVAVDELNTDADWAAPWAFDDHRTLAGRAADLDRIGAFIAGLPAATRYLLLAALDGLAEAWENVPERQASHLADSVDARLFEALHTLLLVCFSGGRGALWSWFDVAAARYPAVPELPATTRSTLADPARASSADLAALDAAITGLAEESDPVAIVRVAMAGTYVDRLGGCAEGLHRVVAAARRGENITPAIFAPGELKASRWMRQGNIHAQMEEPSQDVGNKQGDITALQATNVG